MGSNLLLDRKCSMVVQNPSHAQSRPVTCPVTPCHTPCHAHTTNRQAAGRVPSAHCATPSTSRRRCAGASPTANRCSSSRFRPGHAVPGPPLNVATGQRFRPTLVGIPGSEPSHTVHDFFPYVNIVPLPTGLFTISASYGLRGVA